MTKKRSRDRKRFRLRGGASKDELPPLIPLPEPEPDPPEPNLLEHPTKTATRALRRNLRESQKKGEDPRTTHPFKPRIVAFDEDGPASGEFRPGLNDITAYTIGNLIANGESQEFAAPMAGIPSGTMSWWLAQGRAKRESIMEWVAQAEPMITAGVTDEGIEAKLGPCPATDKYVLFANRVEKCKATCHKSLLSIVWERAIEAKDPVAAQWLLERLFAKQYGKHAQAMAIAEQSGKGQEDADAGDPVDELQRRIIERFERRRPSRSR